MKRSYYLFPLMAMTALSLTLAGCDDKKDDTAATETTTEVTADTAAAEAVAPTAIIQAEGATAYATAEGQANGAVFLTLHNPGTTADKLVGASTPVAATVELHQNAVDANGVATMTKVDAIEVPAGQQVSLSPDGYHIMLMGLTAPLAAGTPFDITLDFETAADVTLPVTVTAPAAPATTEAAPMDHSTMDATDTTTPDAAATTDESPAAPSATDEPVTATEPTVDSTTTAPAETTTEAPAADAPVDEQPAQ